MHSSSPASGAPTASAARSPSRSAPTSPTERFVPGARLLVTATPRCRRRTADRRERARPQRHPAARLRGGRSTARPPRRCAARLLEADVPDERPDEPDEWYDHQLVGLRVARPGTAAELGEVVAVVHLPAQDLLVVRRPDGPRGAGAVRRGDRARGRRRRRTRRRRPAARPARRPRRADEPPATGLSRARRRRHDLPRVPRPAGAVADRQGPRAGLLDVDVHDLRDFTHDRHRTVDDTPYGGGAGMVMRPSPGARRSTHVLAAGRAALGDAAYRACSCPRRPGGRSPRRSRRELAGEPWLVVRLRPLRGHRRAGARRRARRAMPVASCSASATTC